MKTYPLLAYLAVHGRRLALVTALVVALIGIALTLLTVNPLWLLVLVAAAVLYPVLRLVAELVEVIADTLMPR